MGGTDGCPAGESVAVAGWVGPPALYAVSSELL